MAALPSARKLAPTIGSWQELSYLLHDAKESFMLSSSVLERWAMIRRLIALYAAVPVVVAVAAWAPPAYAEPDAGPPSVSPADIRFAHHTLRLGEPRQVGLQPEDVDRMRTDAAAYLQPTPDHPGHPAYAGAAVLAAKDGVVVQRFAVGRAVRYSAVGPAGAGVELPAEQQIPTRPDTIFDLASVSKLFTTIVVMQQVERGRVDLDAPVARYVPEFAAGGKESVTVRNLLTHTSGLPAFLPLWSMYPTPETRRTAALTTPLAPGASPGNQYVYSDLGLIALGVLVERLTGTRLDAAVHAGVTGPLGMVDTGYNPPPSLRDRIAATEYQPYANRGMVWGEVHDENAWALGGVAGHAGIFSTVDDLAVLCQTMLNGGEYRGVRILREATVRSMLVNYNAHLEQRFPESDRGLGFELDKHWYMDGLASPVTFGHTGFTGTSVVVDPLAHSFVILLSNHVHPDRAWGSNNVARRAMARDFANAAPVRPLAGGTGWRTGQRDAATMTLTAPLRAPAPGPSLASFQLWYDTEPRYDVVRVEASTDDGVTWSPVTMTLSSPDGRWTTGGTLTGYGGRRWWHVSATVPTGTTHLRWSYTTDPSAQGRGVYVDRVLVHATDLVLFNGEADDRDRFLVDGWTPASS